MNLTDEYGQLNTLLELTNGAQEVSLVIARDREEQELYYHVLRLHGFEKTETIHDLLELLKDNVPTLRKYLYSVDPQAAKEAYDFVSQYPTGQVELFDSSAMESTVVIPDYPNVAIAFLAIQTDLATLEQQGFSFRTKTGLTYTR